MSSVNKAILVGNLGGDPEIRELQNGKRVCNLKLATSERWRDKNSGEMKEKTEWHRISIFSDGLIGICEKYLKKGSKIFVEGQIRTRKWQNQEGQDQYSTEIVVQGFNSSLQMLEKPTTSAESGRNEYREASRGSGSAPAPADSSFDDEIPF